MLLLASLIFASQPITRIGSQCPLGYYGQGGYCIQNAITPRPTQSIPRTSSSCPLGTYQAGNYCSWRPN